MSKILELRKQGRDEEIWQLCCGFIDLSMDQTMDIQNRLLLEQIGLLNKCELGKKVMQGAEPQSVEEFREQVPLTTYADYACFLQDRHEDVLPEKPAQWQHTSGLSGEYGFKWAPVTERACREIHNMIVAYMLFGTCRFRGDVSFQEHEKMLYAVAPPPYTTGSLLRLASEVLGLDYLPPLEEAESMSFEERIQVGFKMALSEGLDYFFGLPSILVAVADRLNNSLSLREVLSMLTKPGLAMRLGRAKVKAKMAGRPVLPKDIWNIKGIAAAGTDSAVYRERIKEMWGKYPIDCYGSTEGSMMAMQTWDFQDMTFIPFLNFFEFIPEEDSRRSKLDPSYRPRTLLLDEVKEGKNYEIVITNLHGGAFMRYRQGDMLRITSQRNDNLNIDSPQMRYESRVDGLIDLAGFTRLTEKTVWQAIENSGLAYQDWTARKEAMDKPVLHLYLELKQGNGNGNGHDEENVARAIHEQLRKLDDAYCDLEDMIGLLPLQVTLLPNGAFQEYIARQREAGVDLAHLKPPHFNAPDRIVDVLMNGSR